MIRNLMKVMMVTTKDTEVVEDTQLKDQAKETEGGSSTKGSIELTTHAEAKGEGS